MMSAFESPVWGRTDGRFSTFTASAGRFGTVGVVGSRPVSGQSFGGGGGEPPWPAASLPGASGPKPDFPAATRTPTTIPTTTTRPIAIEISRPREVNAMCWEPPPGGPSGFGGQGSPDASGRVGPPQRPFAKKSHLLEDADPLLDRRVGREQVLPPVVRLALDPGGLVQPQVTGG